MLSKNKEKFVKSLHRLKFRRLHDSFFVEGNKMALDALQQKKLQITHVFALQPWVDANVKVSKHSALTIISEREMKKISALKTPSPVLIVAKQMDFVRDFDFSSNGLAALYLDGIQDPGNMGTIIRIADWFGVKQLIASPQSVDFYNPKVIQSTMSSIFRVGLSVMSLDELAQKKGNTQWWATTMSGTPIQQMNRLNHPIILMIGNEGKGLSAQALDLCDTQITILGHPGRGAESLNAAVATGILCSYF